MSLTAGIDVGTSAVKVALFRTDGEPKSLALEVEKIRRRDIKDVVDSVFSRSLRSAGLEREDLDYIATTGDGDPVDFKTGHFYGMTTHARGALYLLNCCRSVLDAGALHGRVMRIDEHSRVLQYAMTSQCASGSGQFLENISRYLGVGIDEVGTLSCKGTQPELVSGICAVLAETDVINMVSRGISTENILKGIHISMANRFVKLLRRVDAEYPVAITGGLARDTGFTLALEERLKEEGVDAEILCHPDSIYAGAIGAALWGAFRHGKLQSRGVAST
ncbi:MAG: benzoyl-CoA reductase subunit D [Candidatus Krumholzibacteria bacterium]|jgi:benzoyl-CoA reductase subunit D|nr:benzoyl-CoA reductase subunit D [Candidatus Krumholzibacteria bacterium]MDP6668444.1 benzoyl-CoA reductase subunit D [Candidatus Krumholzibacteria bacterium]MDP6797265.1 benzoyl-CoA reductase subunit D [Candidatus Krumholzibacteria bacterium]MDP7021832.1 benzoyl-CoA reductase subunit D [Candidatus Krumholzibacteria bacterium]